MNENVHAICDAIQKQFGLDDYKVKSHYFFKENDTGTTKYIFSSEWILAEQTGNEDDFNPDGSAVIDVDLKTNDLRRIIFVGDKSFAKAGVFPTPEIEQSIEWVEETTGMMFGRQFRLVHEDGVEFGFQATVDNMEVAPTGHIDITFNDEGQLTQFSIDGVFPTEDEIEWEPFALIKEELTEQMKPFCTLVETPFEVEEKWLRVWQMSTFFIRNDQSEVIVPEDVYQLPLYQKLGKTLEWNEPTKKEYQSKEINLSPEISYEEAIAKVETKPITASELNACVEETIAFMSSKYPHDSGKWDLTGMYPEKEYIMAEIENGHKRVKVILDRETNSVVHFWNNDNIYAMFQHYETPKANTVSHEDAFEKLLPFIQVTPVYVKEANSNTYRLCGRVDCGAVIDAATGEVIPLEEF